MSRRDKQADLRRRMAEARTKLISSQLKNDYESDRGAAAVEKRPLPPSTGGGCGGILRKPKYTSATATPPTTGPVPKIKETDTNGQPKSALGSLMAGYDESSSDDEGHSKALPVNSLAIQQKSAPAPSVPRWGRTDEGYIANKKHKKTKQASVVIDDAPQRGDIMEIEMQESRKEKTNIHAEKPFKGGGDNGNAAEISDEVWDEFYSLLDDDEAKTANDTANNEPSKPEANAGPLGAEAAPTNIAKKKTKKKKKQGPAKDMYDTEAINNVEQASYEARLARLMLLKSKRTQHGKNETANALPSETEFYDPGLAFHQDGAGTQDGERAAENNAKPNRGTSGEEGSSTSSPRALSNAPFASLAQILRERRDQARKLSSRGNDANGNESVLANHDASDGHWF